MGRASADIIKHKGFKVSGLDVEGVLLQHPAVAEAAVLGLPHEDHGQAVAALVVIKASTSGEQTQQQRQGQQQQQHKQELQQVLQAWCSERLPPYQVPSVWRVQEEPLPRNAMGKVNKKQLVSLFAA
jgi:acyl-coenzyme A synthetase/AMP-(fatty) acid ligase